MIASHDAARGAREEDRLQDWALRLGAARRPVLLAGRGAVWSGAGAAIASLCKALPRLLVCSTPGAKGVVSEKHPQVVGVWGFGGASAATRAVASSDLLLVVGTRLREQSSGQGHERLSQAHVLRIDVCGEGLGYLGNTSTLLVGDARALLERLRALTAPQVEQECEPSVLHAAEVEVGTAPPSEGFIPPQALFDAVNRLAADVPVSADAGNSMCWAIAELLRKEPGQFHVSLDWGSMGFAIPAAIGASLAQGRRGCIAFVGDAAMAMAGGELHTAVELELPIIVVVLNDGGAGMVRAGAEAWFGVDQVPNPSYRYRTNMAAFARGLGAVGISVATEAEFDQALVHALARSTPTLIDAQICPLQVPRALRDRVAAFVSR